MQLSVIEKYKKHKSEVDVLRNDSAMLLLLRIARNLPINHAAMILEWEYPNIVRLQKAGFIAVDEQTIALSEQGKDFLALLLTDEIRNLQTQKNESQMTFNNLELAEKRQLIEN